FFKIKSLLKEAKILKNQQYIIKGYYSLIKHQYSFDDYPYNQIDSIYAYLQSERLKSPEIVSEIFEFLETVILFEYRFTRNYLIYTQNKYDTTELISKMSLTQLDEMIFQRYLNLIKNKTAFNGYSNSKPISNFITQNHSNLKLELFDIIVWEILHNLNKISQLHYNRSTFKLTDPQLLSSYSNFINFPLESIECNTTKKTIEIFQKLIQQYQNSSNKELLAYTDYHRLVWINKFLISSDKTNLFINELEHQFQLFPQIELAAWFGLELGNIYYR